MINIFGMAIENKNSCTEVIRNTSVIKKAIAVQAACSQLPNPFMATNGSCKGILLINYIVDALKQGWAVICMALAIPAAKCSEPFVARYQTIIPVGHKQSCARCKRPALCQFNLYAQLSIAFSLNGTGLLRYLSPLSEGKGVGADFYASEFRAMHGGLLK